MILSSNIKGEKLLTEIISLVQLLKLRTHDGTFWLRRGYEFFAQGIACKDIVQICEATNCFSYAAHLFDSTSEHPLLIQGINALRRKAHNTFWRYNEVKNHFAAHFVQH